MPATCKLVTAVLLTLAVGVIDVRAEEKKENITLAEAKKICGGDRTGCGYCKDQKCEHGWEVTCKGDKCTKTTFFIPGSSPGQKKGASDRKVLGGGGILDSRPGFGGSTPSATGAVAPAAAPAAAPGPSFR
jgi:hypothetical protein